MDIVLLEGLGVSDQVLERHWMMDIFLCRRARRGILSRTRRSLWRRLTLRCRRLWRWTGRQGIQQRSGQLHGAGNLFLHRLKNIRFDNCFMSSFQSEATSPVGLRQDGFQ